MILPKLLAYIDGIDTDSPAMSMERMESLQALGKAITKSISEKGTAELIFICTHNSRRSQFGQVWARTASIYYQIDNIKFYSGGTESTAFHSSAVSALERAGFSTSVTDDNSNNPLYLVKTEEPDAGNTMFSKVFDDQANPSTDFIAVMVCSDADEACPVVPGARERFSIPYLDPKAFDDTDLEVVKYDESCFQIATEMFYLFNLVKKEVIQITPNK